MNPGPAERWPGPSSALKYPAVVVSARFFAITMKFREFYFRRLTSERSSRIDRSIGETEKA
jgi:hypothetical protein